MNSHLWPGNRTLADDQRENPPPPDPTPHVHFHQHDGLSLHAHGHTHLTGDKHPHTTLQKLEEHEEH